MKARRTGRRDKVQRTEIEVGRGEVHPIQDLTITGEYGDLPFPGVEGFAREFRHLTFEGSFGLPLLNALQGRFKGGGSHPYALLIYRPYWVTAYRFTGEIVGTIRMEIRLGGLVKGEVRLVLSGKPMVEFISKRRWNQR